MYSLIALVTLIATTATALDLSSLPSCAQKSAESILAGTGCPFTDVKCICSAKPFVKILQSTVSETCSPTDQQSTFTAAERFCLQAGISLDIIGSSASPATAAAAAAPQIRRITDGQIPAANANASTPNTNTTTAAASFGASQLPDGQVQIATGTGNARQTGGASAGKKNETGFQTGNPVPTGGATAGTKNETGFQAGHPVPFIGGAGRKGGGGVAGFVVLAVGVVVLL